MLKAEKCNETTGHFGMVLNFPRQSVKRLLQDLEIYQMFN